MTNYEIKREVYQSANNNSHIYMAENGVYVWDITIHAGIGEEVYIAHLSDIHYNYCNEQDFAEADPVLMSTHEHRLWLYNGASVPNIRNCLTMAEDADAFVFNGDTLDYLSHGSMELMDREIWDKYPDCIATVGGHEIARQMQGEVAETTTRAERLKILENYWRHDIYYTSKIIKDKVMLIGFLNDCGWQTAEQTEKLKVDLQRAREQGYVVLLFAHEPIVTNNPEHASFSADDILLKGDTGGFPHNYFDGSGHHFPGGVNANAESHAFYDVIYNSADVIKGFFAGHSHNDYELDILAKTPSGEEAIIPQYVHTTSVIGKGHFMRILVK